MLLLLVSAQALEHSFTYQTDLGSNPFGWQTCVFSFPLYLLKNQAIYAGIQTLVVEHKLVAPKDSCVRFTSVSVMMKI